MEYAYKIVFSVVGLRFFYYAVLQKIVFFNFLETFILGPLLPLVIMQGINSPLTTINRKPKGDKCAANPNDRRKLPASPCIIIAKSASGCNRKPQ